MSRSGVLAVAAVAGFLVVSLLQTPAGVTGSEAESKVPRVFRPAPGRIPADTHRSKDPWHLTHGEGFEPRTARIVDRNPRHQRIPESLPAPVSPTAIQEKRTALTEPRTTTSAPGVRVAVTTWDLQHNDAVPHMIATNGSGQYVHFTWTQMDVIPDSPMTPYRFVHFNTYNSTTSSFIYGVGGATLSSEQFALLLGFPTMDVDDVNRARVALQHPFIADCIECDISSWVLDQAVPYYAVFNETELTGSKGAPYPDLSRADDIFFPHIAVDQIPAASDIYHVVAHTYLANDNVVYWRYKSTDVPQWKGPYVLDSCPSLSYNVAADRTSDKCALITEDENVSLGNPNGLLQVTYRESQTNGDDWGPVDLTGLGDASEHFVTSYSSSTGPQAWLECVGDYDNSGNLHVVWNERRFASSTISAQAAWKHWDKALGITSTIHVAYHDNAGTNGAGRINLAYPSLGFGDGTTTCDGQSNLNDLYLTFTQFGGPSSAQQSDVSATGFMNGDVYLSASGDGGLLWSAAVNLTHSLSPGCDPAAGDSCQSENWPSVARTVDDTIHLMYIADRDAGAAPLGEGSWTYNPVMYHRMPGGTNAPLVCPAIAPNLAVASSRHQPDSAYRVQAGCLIAETLTVANLGPGAMTGAINAVYTSPPSGTWLTVDGAGPFGIAPGGDLRFPVTLSAVGLDTGVYTAAIQIANNDTTKPNPLVIPVTLRVAPGCPHQGDLDSSGALDVFDIVRLIDYVFQGGYQPVKDLGCPIADRGDINCDGVDDVMDVVRLIDHVFSGGAAPCGGCGV